MKRRIKSLLSEKELILNSGMVFGASFAGAIFMFVSNIVLSKVFGPELFGNYKTVLGLFLFLPALIDFGATPTLTKYIAEFLAQGKKEKINYLIRFFFGTKLIASFVIGGLAYLFRAEIASVFLKNSSLEYLIVPGIILSMFGVFELSKPVVTGFQKFKLFSASSFITMACIGIFTVYLGYFYGIYYALFGWPIGYLLGNLINFKFMNDWKLLKKSKRFEIKPILKSYSMPMWGMYILNMSNILIIPILSLFFNQTLIGYYSFAWVFYYGIILIPTALSRVLLPKISELNGTKDFKKAKSTLNKTFALYTPIVIIGIIGTLISSKLIITLTAPAYLPSLLIFKTLVCFCLISGYILIYEAYLSAKAETNKVIIWIIIYNIALFAISFVLLNIYY